MPVLTMVHVYTYCSGLLLMRSASEAAQPSTAAAAVCVPIHPQMLGCRSEDRDEPPHVVSWRLTHYGVLEATLTVGGRTFRGELAPLGRTKRPAEASPPDKPPKRLGRPPVRGRIIRGCFVDRGGFAAC
jgi:hypothetical protein